MTGKFSYFSSFILFFEKGGKCHLGLRFRESKTCYLKRESWSRNCFWKTKCKADDLLCL